ncbi:hypothetical protein GJ744_003317 [Endocarpon pusillum]|uniref:FAD-binding domain-containing protein n=1 Tax=Endocarpon pusillum TaxID=364733 RepID=A0A8H7AA37_9EURO|nr:hypothetical protein GJ744_003317 [Endocarpon pusillum]
MAHHDSTGKPFTVAIVGGGIGGLALAIGLRHQGISVQIYEAAPAFAEIGAGIAFGPNAISAMYLIDPAIRDAFRRLATKNGFDEEDETWINFRSGFGEPTMIAKVQTGNQEKTGLSSVHRARFLDELASLIPKEIAHFGKRLLSFQEEASGKLTLIFEDGETAFADVLVGADGVRSRVRQLLLGKESVLDGLSFTGKYAYRGLIAMDKAREAVGDELAMNSQMYLGKDGHVLTYPIDHGKTMNVVAFKNKEDGLWEHDHWVLKNKGEDMRRDFANWGTPVRSVLDLMVDADMWALFDMLPAPTYYKGNVVLVGDAAHASTPHQGAGAGQALEDAFILSMLLGDEKTRCAGDIPAALRAYDAIRRPRSQKVVSTSRAAGATYALQGQARDNLDQVGEELLQRYKWIWDEDMQVQAEHARELLG